MEIPPRLPHFTLRNKSVVIERAAVAFNQPSGTITSDRKNCNLGSVDELPVVGETAAAAASGLVSTPAPAETPV